MEQPKNGFLLKTSENEMLNQYWYSAFTIKKLTEEVCSAATKAAFLSTPSVYFSLPKDSPVRANSWVFDFDEQWSKDPRYCKYDFNHPEAIPEHLQHSFDCVVIDPPFITREVWEKYAQAAKLLLRDASGKVIASTVAENDALLAELLGAKPCAFKPSIPHLIYQYNIFTNYEPTALSESNPEIPED